MAKLITKSSCVTALLLALGLLTSLIGNAVAATCDGVCGTSSIPDGVVTVPPTGGSYRWISTYDPTSSNNGFGQLPGIPVTDGSAGATNGTLYTTSPFTANAGASLNYYFNYITSDGQTPQGGTFVFQDYAWAQLRDLANNIIATLLTARTEPTGSIIPGTDMPVISAILNPTSVPIITVDSTLQTGPTWSPLGSSSGTCYGPGCGYTGWVNSTYAIQNSGTYVLLFGVTNWADTAFDSGLAFSGLTIGGVPIEGEDDIAATPLPAALPLFATGLGALGLLGWRRKRKGAAAVAA
jgi:hypothetical protein